MATVLTNLGEQFVCDFLSAVQTTAADYCAWGTGAGTAVKADTILFTEASEARVQGTKSTAGTAAAAKYQVIGTITADGTKTITNAGLFNASTSGIMLIKGDFTGIALTAGDKIEFTFTLDPS
jgi:hypothetical protein